MRCKACDAQTDNYVPRWDEFYCHECTTIIVKTSGLDFSMEDLYNLMGENDDNTLGAMFSSFSKGKRGGAE